MIDLLCIWGVTQRYHHIRLNGEFQADLQWWHIFAVHWNGVTMLPHPAGAAEPGPGVTGSSLNGPRVSRVFTSPLKELFAGLR